MRSVRREDILTTGQVARICRVAPRTVTKWFDTGRLQGYRIPGSRDRRIPRQQLVAFMKTYGIPTDCLEDTACRLLIVDAHLDAMLRDSLAAFDRYRIQIAQNRFEAGMLAQQFRPHVILLEAADSLDEALEICRSIKSMPGLDNTRILLASAQHAPWPSRAAEAFDDFLPKPYTLGQLVEAVERATNLIS